MKILLMKPISDIYYVIQPNLGLGYLATILLDAGHDVRIMNSGKEKLGWDDFTKLIKEEQYDLVGIQVFTHEVLSAKKHIGIIKKYLPDTIVICGGAHVCGDPQGTMHFFKGIDFGFIGEAEIGLEKFIRLKKEDYTNCELLRSIPNLIWRNGEKIIVNPRESFQDLDRIKFPAWHLIPIDSYPIAPQGTFSKKIPVAPIIISRGCPFQCTFCAGKSVTGQAIRYRSVNNAISEIVFLHNTYGVKEIHISDDNFTLKRDYVVNFCNAIIKLGLDIVFALPNGVRLDTLDEEVLRLMEKAGFYSMAIGIESGSDRILSLMKKNLTKKVIKEKIDLIKNTANINLTGFFLVGYPGEKEKEILETIEFAKSLKIDKASFMFVMPVPGSDLWDTYMNKETKFDWGLFFYYRIVEGLSDIPVEKLRKLQRKAILEFYLRPKIILGLIQEIKTYNQIKILALRMFNQLIPTLR